MPTPIEVADSLEPEFRDSFLAVIEVIKAEVSADQLDYWLENRDFPAIMAAFEEVVGQALTFSGPISSSYQNLVTSTMTATTGLDLVSPVVFDRIATNAGRLIVGVGQDSLESIRSILSEAYLSGLTVRQSGRVIRSVVGLLPSHAAAVGRYSAGLEEAHIPAPERTRLVETYARRLLAYRAENISRTETIAASHSGLLEGWLDMAQRGVLDRSRTRVVWKVTEDDRLCPWCAPMDNVEVALGELFVSTHKGFPEGKPEDRGPGSKRMDRTTLRPDPRSQPRDALGRFASRSILKRDTRTYLDNKLVPLPRQIAVQHPPLHPQCRCTLVLRFLP